MQKISAVLLLAVLIIAGHLPAADHSNSTGPAIVLIIRHGEKPDKTDTDKDPNLSPRGYERAAALAHVIPDHFPHPDFLIATKKSAHSDRPHETIAPLAKAMHLEIESNFKDDQVTELAHEILTDPKYAGKTVLIAWHHEKIPDLAHALGATTAPDAWSSKLFDRVWKITYDKGVATLTDLPQKALPGDSEK